MLYIQTCCASGKILARELKLDDVRERGGFIIPDSNGRDFIGCNRYTIEPVYRFSPID